eukprot:2664318-Karenia_brevis.AAC.1
MMMTMMMMLVMTSVALSFFLVFRAFSLWRALGLSSVVPLSSSAVPSPCGGLRSSIVGLWLCAEGAMWADGDGEEDDDDDDDEDDHDDVDQQRVPAL